jgi:hypothetical protein
LPEIKPWPIDQGRILKVPAGVTHAVLDTQGGLYGFELAKVVMGCDVVLMPVCNSIFDRESALVCYQELMTLPRVATGKCRIGVFGMRIDARTKGGDILREWATAAGIPFVGVLRESQLYVRSLELGMTLFDLPGLITKADRQQWEPILNWLQPLLLAATEAVKPEVNPERARPSVPASMLSRFLQEQRAARNATLEPQYLA